MKPFKEITLYCEGLTDADKEALLSVLVLAEIRLESRWILQVQREGADVCLFRHCGLLAAEHPGPVICYAEPGMELGEPMQDGLYFLQVDANGVPTFSGLIAVFNQVDAGLSCKVDSAAALSAGEPVQEPVTEFEPVVSATIPTLTVVVDELSGPAQPGLETGEVQASSTASRKRPWLDQIAAYIQDIPQDSFYHKILLQSGEVILLDLEQDKFYSSIEVETFLEESGENKTSYIAAMDRVDFKVEQNKQAYFERPLSNLKWFLALYSNVRGLEVNTDRQVYLLSGWPESSLPGLHRDHLKLAAFMRARRSSLVEISAETGIAVDDIRSFVEACYYEGLIQTDREPEQKHKSTPEKPRGFWAGVLGKIRW